MLRDFYIRAQVKVGIGIGTGLLMNFGINKVFQFYEISEGLHPTSYKRISVLSVLKCNIATKLLCSECTHGKGRNK